MSDHHRLRVLPAVEVGGALPGRPRRGWGRGGGREEVDERWEEGNEGCGRWTRGQAIVVTDRALPG